MAKTLQDIEALLPKGHCFSVAYEIKVCYSSVLYMHLIYAARAEASVLAIAHGPLSPPPNPLLTHRDSCEQSQVGHYRRR